MAVQILKVEYVSKNVKEFVELPWKIYQGNRNWVPPLKGMVKDLLSPKKNPFFKRGEVHLFLAQKNGNPVGRIAAILNRAHNLRYQDRTGFFGLFETAEDPEVASSLLNTAAEEVASRTMTTLRGPVSLSMNDECGLLIDGFDKQPFVMMPYNPPYYQAFLENHGFKKARDLYAYYLDASNPSFEVLQLLQMAEVIQKREGVAIRSLNMKRFDEEIEIIRNIYNDAWSNNWGFVPMEQNEFAAKSRELKMILEPRLAFIVECGNAPVGFGLLLPNINEILTHLNGRLFPFGFLKFLQKWKYISSVRVITLGMKQKFQQKGLGIISYAEMLKRAQKLGCARGEMSWVLEDNLAMNKAILQAGGKLDKTYRIYDKAL